MRIKVVFKVCDELALPRAYQSLLRDFLIDLAKANKDFQKLNFSNLKGDFKSTENKQLVFTNNITLYVSSTDEAFIEALNNNLADEVYINNQKVLVESKQMTGFVVKFNKYSLRTLSACTVYENIGNKSKFYNPNDSKYFEIINKNIKGALKNQELDDVLFTDITNVKKIITLYKNTIVEGYMFECRIDGPKEAISQIYNNGIGNRTFQGFGMCMLGK